MHTLIKSMQLYIFVGIVSFAGCNASTREPTPKWKVELIKPDGEVHKTYTVTSSRRPVRITTWGGITYLKNKDTNNCFDKIMAPSGWLIEVERKANDGNKISSRGQSKTQGMR